MSGERGGRPPSGPPNTGAPTRVTPAVSASYDSNENATLANLHAADMPDPRATLATSTDVAAALARGPGVEEPTMQGASFLVERITPVPPARDTLMHAPPRVEPQPIQAQRPAPAPPGIAAQAARMAPAPAPPANDEATAAVPNPGSRPPPREASVAALQLRPPTVPPVAPALQIAATPRGPQDAPPEMDTAFVPVVGQALSQVAQAAHAAHMAQGGGLAAPQHGGFAPAQPYTSPQAATVTLGQNAPNLAALAPARPAGPVRVFLQKNFPNILVLSAKVQANKNARLGLIAACGMLGVALTLWLVPVRSQGPQPQGGDGAGAAAVTQPQRVAPPAQKDNPDPVQQEERDRLLEKGVLAVEAGRSEEALAIFRRYSEEDENPAAAFMIQLLQVQLSQNGREQ